MDKMDATRGHMKFARPNTIKKNGQLEFNSEILTNICSFIFYVKLFAVIVERCNLTSHQNRRVSFRRTFVTYTEIVLRMSDCFFTSLGTSKKIMNIYCELLSFFSYKETQSIFLHMDQIT